MIEITNDMHYATVLEKVRDIENAYHPDGHPDAGMKTELMEAAANYEAKRRSEGNPSPAAAPDFPRYEHSANPRSEITGLGERISPQSPPQTPAYMAEEMPAQQEMQAQPMQQTEPMDPMPMDPGTERMSVWPPESGTHGTHGSHGTKEIQPNDQLQ